MPVFPGCHVSFTAARAQSSVAPHCRLRTRRSESHDTLGRFLRLLLEGFFSCLYCFCVRRESNPQRFYCARFTVWCDSTIVTADAICERNKKPDHG